MRNSFTIRYLILVIIPLFFGCRGPVKEGSIEVLSSSVSLHVGSEKYLAIDKKQSVVIWKGSNLLGSNSHTGYVSISKGELKIENGQLVNGIAEIDMNTIQDDKHQSNNGLVEHLKDPDFFDVKKFPFSTFIISKSEPINVEENIVKGNLTIKGITHLVTFPAKIETKNGIVKMSGKLVIDRTKWDVRYKSRKFFDLVADQTISDSIEFNIKIVAKR
ncbi:YceI family protein [Pseudomonas shirazensis]